MINSHLVSSAPTVPPRSLIDNTYSALKKRVREALLAEWPKLLPTPGYYHHLPSLNPRPFMGLDKFMAGRVYQMRAGKGYLAAHPTGRSPDADTSNTALAPCSSPPSVSCFLLSRGVGLLDFFPPTFM